MFSHLYGLHSREYKTLYIKNAWFSYQIAEFFGDNHQEKVAYETTNFCLMWPGMASHTQPIYKKTPGGLLKLFYQFFVLK